MAHGCSPLGVEPAAEAEHDWPAARVARAGGAPTRRRRVARSASRAADLLRLSSSEKKPVTTASRSRTTENVSGASSHQRAEQRGGLAASCRPAIAEMAAASSPRGLDRERLGAAREERLAHDRVLDQVQHVGGVAPELAGAASRTSSRSSRHAARR